MSKGIALSKFLRAMIKALSKIFLLGYVFAFCIDADAQTPPPPGTPKVIPPSPTASALIKYADVPVSYSTGVPQIKIPIHTISGKEVTLPIELSYHAGGMKVGEKPGWLGLSWSLPGANNVISRTIRGLPDTHTLGYRNNFALVNQAVINEQLQNQILEGQVDGDPDEYSYNFVGRGGKLLFTNNAYIPIPYENLQVSIDEAAAGIVTEDGTQYNFQVVEKYQSDELLEYTQTWHLSSISNPNGTEVINFHYSNPFLVDEPMDAWMTTEYHTLNINCPIKDPVIVDRGQERLEVRLQKITFEETEVRFYGQTRLDSIVIYEANVRSKRFILEYDSYHLLYQVSEEAIGNSNILKHKLAYYGGGISNPYARDHWGFQNGANSNFHLFPHSDNAIPPAIRDPSAKVSVQAAGSLQSITYPTGGYAEFEYEPNAYWNGGGEEIVTMGQIYKPVFASWDNAMANSTITSSYFFTIAGEVQPVAYDISAFTNNGEGEGQVVDVGQVMTFDLYRVGESTPLVTYNVPNTDLTATIHPQFIRIGAGNYEARVTLTPPNSPSTFITDLSIHVGVSYVERIVGEQLVGTTAGGIRIKKITISDGMGVSPDQIRTFQYTRPLTTPAGVRTISSGNLTLMPEYTYTFTEHVPSPVNQIDLMECVRRQVSNGEEAIAGMGPTVYYSQVTEFLGANGEFGKTEYFFEPAVRTASAHPYPQISVDYRAGLPAGVKKYKKAGSSYQPVYESSTAYEFHEDVEDPHKHSIQGVKVLVSAYYVGIPGADPVVSIAQPYTLKTGWFHNKRQIETFYEGGQQRTDTTLTFYENPTHVQVTKTQKKNSDGSITIQEMKYPDDYTGLDPALVAMKDLHMVNQVIRQLEKLNENSTIKIISGMQNKFEKHPMTPGVVLKEVYTFKHPEPLAEGSIVFDAATPFTVNTNYFERKLTFNAFDDHANILRYTSENNFSTSYIWDCEMRRPIAQAINASNTIIAFAGFECNDHGGWTVNGGAATTTAGNFTTGLRGWQGGVLTKSVSAGNYVVSLWAKGTGNITVNTVSKSVSSTWQLLEWQITNTVSVTVTTNGNTVDEVRLLPQGAQMTTYTYDVGGRVTSVTDVNSQHNFYEYDQFKRLRAIKNHRGEILNVYEYHYKD